jgi:two-component system cell cycle sensor histidine kinase/response regulator CckA
MADPRKTAPMGVTILVVEDSPTQLETLRFLLEEAGYAVIAATNGRKGLAAAKANAIDLVLSDIVMPELDGYGLCKALRADDTLRHLPVILLTSLTDPQDVIRGLESGVNNFIYKPYDDRALLARVQNVLANEQIRKTAPTEIGSVIFAGQRFFITADRLQILDLLLSTYENAVNRNNEVVRTRDELRILNEQLEVRVAERTASLAAGIEERKRAEEALRSAKAFLDGVINSIADPVFVKDEQRRFVLVNDALCAIVGSPREALLGTDGDDAFPAEQVAVFRKMDTKVLDSGAENVNEEALSNLSTGDVCTIVTRKTRYIDPAGSRFLVGVIRDVTERKRAEAEHEKLEEQLRAAQKMEAIGSLAGGIAHDFNNLLSVILNYAGFALDHVREGDPLRDDLLEVKKAGERAAVLTRQLLAFGRKQVLQPVPLDLNLVLADTEKMLRRIVGEDIDFIRVETPDLGLIMVDPGQLEQVIMNLVVNARDSMPDGGKLTVETSNVEIDGEYTARHVAVAPGPYVLLAVTDTGCGMDEQTKARLFEPFFTTKAKGKGTGLGLSTVYGIVKQSGGNIWVYSELGRGTTFKVYLPRDLSATAATVIRPPKVPRRTTGTETILLVEDEEALRKAARRALDAAGYTVLTAADGVEALQTSAQHGGDIHLLLTDVIMPRMNGRMLAQELSKSRPATKVLYMSGYTDDAIVHHGVLDAGAQFLAKPFTAADLKAKVREVLDGGITDLADGHEQELEPAAEPEEQRPDKDAVRALPAEVLGKLRQAVIAGRYDDLVELIETIRTKEPGMARGLRRMADLFDSDGLRELLGP